MLFVSEARISAKLPAHHLKRIGMFLNWETPGTPGRVGTSASPPTRMLLNGCYLTAVWNCVWKAVSHMFLCLLSPPKKCP